MQSIVDSDCLEQIEVLVIDDGSIDRTAEIALDYEKQYPETVRLVKKANGGHGSTINKGIEEANGKFFRAIDGDDWVSSENLSDLVVKLDTINADMIICDYDKCFQDGKVITERFENCTANQIIKIDKVLASVDWMCYHTIIYRTEILREHNIRLDENCFYVDTEYDLLPIPYIETAYYFDKPLYCYRLGLEGQSVSPESKMKHIKNGLTVANRLLKLLENLPSNITKDKRKYIIDGTADHCIWYIRSLLIFPASNGKRKEIKAFDNFIKHSYFEVYEAMNRKGRESRIIRFLRNSNYQFYWIIKLYKGFKETY